MDSATDSLDSEFFARTSRFFWILPHVHWATIIDIDAVRNLKFTHAELTRWGIFCRDYPRRPCQRPRISRFAPSCSHPTCSRGRFYGGDATRIFTCLKNNLQIWNETVVYVKITQIFQAVLNMSAPPETPLPEAEVIPLTADAGAVASIQVTELDGAQPGEVVNELLSPLNFFCVHI